MLPACTLYSILLAKIRNFFFFCKQMGEYTINILKKKQRTGEVAAFSFFKLQISNVLMHDVVPSAVSAAVSAATRCVSRLPKCFSFLPSYILHLLIISS